MSDGTKDEIVQCGCGWCGTREDSNHHRRTDPRHQTANRITELEAALAEKERWYLNDVHRLETALIEKERELAEYKKDLNQ